MSFDLKYRPRTYDDVLGQETTIQILKQFIISGRARQQSYVFCGERGRGKTTLARIFARAILCDQPVDGNPCDKCPSCLDMLKGSSDAFSEVDAATHSGKSDVQDIVNSTEYVTMSGKKRLFLLDESHQLSRQALDGLLKPLEDSEANSDDKKLVVIFATTEPQNMRDTILSRCAPAFLIRPVDAQMLVDRLVFICQKESLAYEEKALEIIVKASDLHIRDALKALEGVSMLGEINVKNTKSYLNIHSFTDLIDLLLASYESNIPEVSSILNRVLLKLSPLQCYEHLSTLCLAAYQHTLGIKNVSAMWDAADFEKLTPYKDRLLADLKKFSSAPRRATQSMLFADLMTAISLPSAPMFRAPPPKVENPLANKLTENGVYVGNVSISEKQTPKKKEISRAEFGSILREKLYGQERPEGVGSD